MHDLTKFSDKTLKELLKSEKSLKKDNLFDMCLLDDINKEIQKRALRKTKKRVKNDTTQI